MVLAALAILALLPPLTCAQTFPALYHHAFIYPVPSFDGMHFGEAIAVSGNGVLVVRAVSNNHTTDRTLLVHTENAAENATEWVLSARIASPDKAHAPDFASSFAFLADGSLAIGSGGASPTEGVLHIFAAPHNSSSEWTLALTVPPPVVMYETSGILVRLSTFGSAMAASSSLVAVAALNEAVALYSYSSDTYAHTLIVCPNANACNNGSRAQECGAGGRLLLAQARHSLRSRSLAECVQCASSRRALR